ncbi:MAG: DHA2 family efflux MFS transporter permease subunit [candidate division Zixibacteria bacterium]|nr:DHA2 family efflux MFS transporter permease subunit [candidate division Zixibacteria bacterium]
MSKWWSQYRRRLVERYDVLDPEHDSYRWLVLAAVMIATFMAVLDATVVNVAIPKLMATFGVSVDSVEWVLTAYLLVFAVVLPSSGWFADHFGYKRVFILGLLLFIIGSLLCSLSWSLNVLIAFRIIQGIGAGCLMPIGMAIVAREFPPEKRGIALGFWSMAASASVSLGPTVGGYLVDNYSWHTIFDVNIPIGVVGLIVLLVVLREYKAEKARTFDVVGFLSLSTFLTALLLALSSGNSAWNNGGWTSTYILSCFAISAVGLLVFLVTEFSVEHPLIELALFKHFNFAVCNLISFMFGIGMFGSTFLLPIYLQNSLGYTPLQSGLVFLPVGIMQGLAAPFAGHFADKHNAKIPLLIGLALMAYTFYQFGFLSMQTEHSAITVPLFVRGLAMGMIFAPMTATAILGISNIKMAQASGILNVIRQVGGSVGVALFGSLLVRRAIFHSAMYGQQLDAQSDIYKQTMMRLQQYASHVTGGTVAQASGKAKVLLSSYVQNQAFVQGISDVFLIAGVIVLVSAAPVFFLRVRRKAKTESTTAVRTEPVEVG